MHNWKNGDCQGPVADLFCPRLVAESCCVRLVVLGGTRLAKLPHTLASIRGANNLMRPVLGVFGFLFVGAVLHGQTGVSNARVISDWLQATTLTVVVRFAGSVLEFGATPSA